ncbi:Alpha-ketoglutarate-dependent sulfonate dioxygenase [Cyberlindnera fabianii]|uniref:Alpha-ketoglutarate-dependent sulfonate dioxygenase n=1 Tax=Cyberlindnera fabianii TaxID=36022 RepID=A0A1V2L793_CYBFA|nr:Alpha-ketoglutarate-dependent sulfonate dioxygenase [Cyberlindnera fabianii]
MVTATATSTVTVPAAPIKEAKGILDSAGIQFSNLDIHFRKGEDVIDPVTGVLKVADKEYSSAKYPEWLPTWDPSQKFAQYSDDFNKAYRDPGLDADPELRSLFPPQSKDKYSIKKLSPKLGSEIRGIQLSELSTQAKNDLALFVAQRGVVVFRNQDLKDKGLEFNKKLGEHFGPLHVHPSSGAPENYPQFHITYRRHDPEEYNKSKNDGGIERREPSTVVHPLVRVHPVLKKKALYVSRFFMQDIEGLKKEESNAILDLLTDHINNSFDLQIRASYEPGTVVVWDNRRVLHTATFDWDTGATRHCYRITPMGERPVEDEEELEECNK